VKTPRKPRDLDAYSPAEDVARALENMAARIRRGGGLVKFSIQFWFYDTPGTKTAMIEEKSSAPLPERKVW
jgi:hypothetical protein